MDLWIRPARDKDADALTDLFFASKTYWNYPDHLFASWKDEATITREYLRQHRVFVAEDEGQVIGYFAIVEVRTAFWAGDVYINKGFWLEHMYVMPAYLKKGIGTEMFYYSKEYCQKHGIPNLNIFADTEARSFYRRLGADYVGDSQSGSEGRAVSRYRFEVKR